MTQVQPAPTALQVVRRRGRVSRTAATVIQASLLVGALLTAAFGLPGLLAQARGVGNSTLATNDYALALIGLWAVVLVVISQIKINVTNAYSGSLAWTNSFTRVTKRYPGRLVFVIFNVSVAYAYEWRREGLRWD